MIRRLSVCALSAAFVAALGVWSSVPLQAADTEAYVVLYGAQAVPADAATRIARAGGTLVASYDEIGVVIARSGSLTFRSTLLRNRRVEGVAATTRFATRLNDDASTDTADAPADNTPAAGNDSLSGLQWDMVQIHAPEARAITGGSSSIVVGDIDTGLDDTHPDLAPNFDGANSVSCVSGAPVTTFGAWRDDNGHGTHTAGTIAAALNGIGIVGVAPNVRIAGIKAGNANGFFFPEAVICAFYWVGTHPIQVTNNSYFADPWLFNCRNDAEQRAIWTAERRAIRFAMQHGTVVVAAEGNQADDLAHPTQDVTSPDNTTPVIRTIHNNCAIVPTEVPGVIAVAANGNLQLKSYYSSYGVGVTDLTAPGGDLDPAADGGGAERPSSVNLARCAD